MPNEKNVEKFNFIFSLTVLAIIFSLSSEVSCWFDGLPWTNATETLATIIAIPFLLIVGHHFLSTKSSVIFLAILLALKLILHLGAPISGWKVKVSPNLENLESGDFKKTYFTIWQKDVSATLKKGWTDKKQFPIDWFIPLGDHPIESLNIVEGSLEKKFKQFSLWMTVEGVVRLPPNTKLVLLTKGTKYEALDAVSLKGEKISIPIINSLEEVQDLKEHPSSEEQIWSISGKFNYFGDSWAFQPFIVYLDGNIEQRSENDFFWQDKSVIGFKDIELKSYLFLGKTFDCGLFAFLLIWCFRSFQCLKAKKIISYPIIFFSSVAMVLPWLLAIVAFSLSLVRLPYPLNPQYLSLSIFATGVGVLTFNIWKPKALINIKTDLGHSVFLLFGPAVLFYFTVRWWSDLGQVSLWSLGDDWATYQKLARLIVVDGQWLTAGEPVFHHQPFYRYIVAFLHLLFGPPAMAMRLADIWFLLGTAVILVFLATRYGLSAFTTVLVSSLFIAVGAGEFPHIGNGLAEFATMFFVMLATLFLSQRPTNYSRVLMAGGLATIGCWLHLDRIGVAGGIACLLINQKKGKAFYVWKSFLRSAISNWKFIAVYLAVLGAGLISIVLRNGFVGGRFAFVTASHPNFTGDLLWGNIFLLLTGKTWPDLPMNTTVIATVLSAILLLGLIGLGWCVRLFRGYLIRIVIVILGLLSPFLFFYISDHPPFIGKDWNQLPIDTLILTSVLVPGTLLGITALVWRPAPLAGLPLSLGIIMLGLFSPYLFLHIWGYPPRYSTQLLPWAILSLGIVFDYFFKKYLEKPMPELSAPGASSSKPHTDS